MESVARTYAITGTVQGVGFRPTVFRLATHAGISGWVQNRSGTVRLHLQAPMDAIAGFLDQLRDNLPPHAVIASIRLVDTPAPKRGAGGFRVLASGSDDQGRVQIPPDLSMCADCLADIRDPANRRYGYPFTTCTNCGPRYTVVTGMPYDRERTTMQRFLLCGNCQAEYGNPVDRRFHAESIACPVCGPQLALCKQDGERIPGPVLREARRLLASGAILAVRGLGGFQLIANALNREAIAALRHRKRRPAKPLAVMARNVDIVRNYCRLDPAAHDLLTSPAAPIVILDRHEPAACEHPLPGSLSPDTRTLGVMLPTTPLHQLLFEPLNGDPLPAFDLLVATSGNRRGEPICLSNDEALDRLHDIADFLLGHDRDIRFRNDDSVVGMHGDRTQVWRRARGMTPGALPTFAPVHRCTLALGAELKNTIALASNREVALSPHVGDLAAPEAMDGLLDVLASFAGFLEQTPEQVAVDLHPDMFATRTGEKYAAERNLPVVRVQHHVAHAAACLAEHGRDSGLCLTFDGTGYGEDGTIWGAELLHVSPQGYDRLATFRACPLPGADEAVREPLRQLVARLHEVDAAVPGELMVNSPRLADDLALWRRQVEHGILAPPSHSAGRLFDAVAALLGVAPERVSYEGQAAIRLESLAASARHGDTSPLPYLAAVRSDGILEIDWRPAFRHLLLRRKEVEAAPLALAFHEAVAEAACEMVHYGLKKVPGPVIGLSGGVFMNRLLTRMVAERLADEDVAVLIHERVPPNDGCIAFGQAIVAGTWDVPEKAASHTDSADESPRSSLDKK